MSSDDTPAASAQGPQGSAALPSMPASLLRALAPWKRAATATTTLPAVEARVVGWRPDPAQLAAYRALIGSVAELPMVFPQNALTALHRDLLSRWSFPIRVAGLIHPGFRVQVLGELPWDAAWDLRAWISGERHVRSGLEFDLCGEVSVDGRVLWASTAPTLSRSRSASGTQESGAPRLEDVATWDAQVVLPVPADAGRAFAGVSGDVNPIHLHPATARIFGHSRPIAHGWWTAGRILAALGVDEAVTGRSLEIRFRRPVELPSSPMLLSRWSDGTIDFALAPDGPGRAAPDPGADPTQGAAERPLVRGRIHTP